MLSYTCVLLPHKINFYVRLLCLFILVYLYVHVGFSKTSNRIIKKHQQVLVWGNK